MAANDKQVGGAHYRHPVQHWDWAQFLPYLEGVCTKYFGRHFTSKGAGIQDIDKGLHYVQKIVEKHYPGWKFTYHLEETLEFEQGIPPEYVNPDRDHTIVGALKE